MAVLPSSWAASALLHAVAFGSLVVVSRRAGIAPYAPPAAVDSHVELALPPASPRPRPPVPESPPPTPNARPPREAAVVRRAPHLDRPSTAAPAERESAPAPDHGLAEPLDLTGPGAPEVGSFALRVGGGSGGAGTFGNGNGARGASIAPVSEPPRSTVTPSSELSRLPSPPELASALLAHYPSRARATGETGTAAVSLLVLADGRVSEVVVRSATAPDFGRACVETLRGSRWLGPLDRQGRPTVTRVGYICIFDVR